MAVVTIGDQERRLKELALGRIFRIASRPYQEGDIEEYERCRAIIMSDMETIEEWAPRWARDRLKGAQGD